MGKRRAPKSTALSLHVADEEYRLDLEVDDDAVPLKIYDPNFSSAEKCLRRSSRSTTNKYKSANNHTNLSALSSSLVKTPIQNVRRRSPRLCGKLTAESSVVKRRRQEKSCGGGSMDEDEDEEEPASKKVKLSSKNSNAKVFDKKCLRRSPRILCSSGEVECELLALPEAPSVKRRQSSKKMNSNCATIDSASISNKCLRSRVIPFALSVEAKSSPLLLFQNQEEDKKKATTTMNNETTPPRNSDLGVVSSEKCLRSRKTQFRHVIPAAEKVEPPDFGLIEGSNSAKNESTIIGTTTKKCLRSRVIPFAVVAEALHENAAAKSAIVQTLKNREESPLSNLPITSSEKCLRSRKVQFRVVEETEKVERECSSLIKRTNSAYKWQPLENKSKEVKKNESPLVNSYLPIMSSDAKCLRSRKMQFRGAIIEEAEQKVETECGSLTEWPTNLEEKQPHEKKRKKSNNNKASVSKERKQRNDVSSFFIGEPVPDDEARERWRWRYQLKSQRCNSQSWILNADEEDEIILNVECHYSRAKVGGCIINLGDCAYIKGKGRQKDIGRIVEFFKTTEGEDYFRVQWFYRAEDTVMKEAAAMHDKKRIFYSTLMNDNLLDCIDSKVDVVEIAPVLALQPNLIPQCDFYYDMEYCAEYSTFRTLLAGSSLESRELSLPSYPDTYSTTIGTNPSEDLFSCATYKVDLALLDLYSGCGGMSTGLCLGAKLSSVNLVTRWAIDYHKSACDSLKLNHPETEVRHTTAEDFLELLREWEKLCKRYLFNDNERTLEYRLKDRGESKSKVDDAPSDVNMSRGEYEVSCLVDICYGDPSESGEDGLKFKVRWKGYDQSEDTWEPIDGLSNCQEHIRDFVRSGRKSKILPLPGDVDVICGGPPCQGISGYNRYRSIGSPLNDERNRQIIVFMDIVKFLKPKYVLMENVVDILKFDKASLGRYALSRLVEMKYQARLGTMAAGCYGLPQFRLRVFLWGALPTEKLPQFPLPTHDVVVRYWPPNEFEQNTVAYNEGQPRDLEEAVVLRDAISDLPAVTSHETREEMMYERPPESEFQKYIRLTKYEMMGFVSNGYQEAKRPVLYDHRPYQLSEDDYLRVCQIPHKKGANFRDLPGVIVSAANVALRDPKEEPLLPSGKRLVPDYVFTFEKGKSKRPFARLWWDETVATVITFPSLHNQAALHPEQDRVLTLREYARLQGFPDFYRFCGTVKERYCQVGNAVAIPVARALGYALGMAFRKLTQNEPLMTLPPKFAFQQAPIDEIFILENRKNI